MARSIWTGAISFGLVTVPVKLYSAVQRKTVRFHQLDSEDRRAHPAEARRPDDRRGGALRATSSRATRSRPTATWSSSPSELEALEPKKTKTIEIEDFVELDRDRPDLLRPPVLPGARRRRRQALPAAARRDARDRQGRDRQGRHPLRRSSSSRSARWATCSAMSTMLFADEVVDAEPHRRAPRRRRGRDHRPRAGHRQAARRVAGRRLRARQVPGHLPRGGPRADRAQGGGRGDRRPAGAPRRTARRCPT